MVTWLGKDGLPITTINVCRHMGSRLDEGKVVCGALRCPYHGLKHGADKKFGETMFYQDKLWWSYAPRSPLPPSIPFYNDTSFATSHIVIDMPASVPDCIMNTMDLVHPAYVHTGIFGFGSHTGASKIKHYRFPAIGKQAERLGLSFNYHAGGILSSMNGCTENFHMFTYPYQTWSRVSPAGNAKDLYIFVDMLPLHKDVTRLFVTVRHNYFCDPIMRQVRF